MDDFSFRTVLKSLLLPPTGPLLLAFIGLALTRTSRSRLGLTFVATGLASLWLLATPIVANELVAWWQYPQGLNLSRPVDAQAIVILAGGARRRTLDYGGPTPATLTLQRLVYGARVAHKTRLPVLITGGKTETRAMAAMLSEDFGIKPRWTESKATNTHENATLSHALLAPAGIKRIILVTSALHMQRAKAEFEAQGFIVTAAAVDVRVLQKHEPSGLIPGVFALHDSEYVAYEVLGELMRRASRR